MNQDSHVTQRLTEAQVQKPIHRAQSNMIWHLEWHGTNEEDDSKMFRAAQFARLRHAQDHVLELANDYNMLSYTITRI